MNAAPTPQPKPDPEPQGGPGGRYMIPAGGKTDIRLEQRAIRQRWNIPEQYRQAVVDRQIKTAIDPSTSNREATAAARVLVSMEDQNMEQERRDEASSYEDVPGTKTQAERREFFRRLGQELSDMPEKKARVAAILRECMNGQNGVNGHTT